MRTATGHDGLSARSIGPGVPGGEFDVRVHSVFRSALNLELEGEPLLVTLFDRDGPEAPQGIRLEAPQDFSAWRLARGSRGALGPRALVLEGGPEGQIEVDLTRAERATAVPLARVRHLGPAFDACRRGLARIQETKGCDLRIDVLLQGERAPTGMGACLAAGARELGAAATRLSLPAAAVAALRLLGLGPGATPAGDDFLCGFLFAIGSSARAGAQAAFLAGLGEALGGRLAATSDLSRTFLRCALRALAPTALGEMAAALSEERPLEAVRALGRVCALGHSSGADLASGFLYGLAIWAGQAEPPGA